LTPHPCRCRGLDFEAVTPSEPFAREPLAGSTRTTGQPLKIRAKEMPGKKHPGKKHPGKKKKAVVERTASG
jgi:hypothetical protein